MDLGDFLQLGRDPALDLLHRRLIVTQRVVGVQGGPRAVAEGDMLGRSCLRRRAAEAAQQSERNEGRVVAHCGTSRGGVV